MRSRSFPILELGDGSFSPSAPDSGEAEDKDSGDDLPSPFGRYRIIKPLGKGGMAVVYLEHDTQFDHPPPDGAGRSTTGRRWTILRLAERFLREARATVRFHHVNFCSIFDVG